MSDYEYNPGSEEALEHGCTCPVLDNPYKGIPGEFITSVDCPLHGEDT